MYFSSTKRCGLPENGRAQDRLKGDTSSHRARARMPHTWFWENAPRHSQREAVSRRLASWHTELMAALPRCEEIRLPKTGLCKAEYWLQGLKKCPTHAAVLPHIPELYTAVMPASSSEASGSTRDRILLWSAGLGCYGNFWLPELFIFPLQSPTKWLPVSRSVNCSPTRLSSSSNSKGNVPTLWQQNRSGHAISILQSCVKLCGTST